MTLSLSLLSLLLACGEDDSPKDDTGTTGDSEVEAEDTGPWDQDGDGVYGPDDCDDDNADASVVETFYADADGDGFGDAATTIEECGQPEGYVLDATDCDDADAEVNPGAIEECDGADQDCDGEIDEAEAVGTGATCAAESCVEVLEAGNTDSDLYWIDFGEYGVATAWCEQEREGGGWMLMWKQHGGASGAEESTNTLWSSEGSRNDVVPHDQVLTSEVTSLAYPILSQTTNVELLKVQSLYDPSDALEAEHETVLSFDGTSFSGFFSNMELAGNGWACHEAPGSVSVSVDGVDVGTTSVLMSYLDVNGPAFGAGLPSTYASDSCGQTSSNILDMDSAAMHRLDGGDSRIALRTVFSYNHLAETGDATRCNFACWDETWNGGYYDGVTWYGRPPQDGR
jgi:hypothetical protein